MDCPVCGRTLVAGRAFCPWCEAYALRSGAGVRATVLRRLGALLLDWLCFGLASAVVAAVLGGGRGSESVGWVLALVVWLAVFRDGTTPGKKLLGLAVIDRRSGQAPGVVVMLLRETICKAVSLWVFLLGYLWALFDGDRQTWHDKMVGSVVVHREEARIVPAVPAAV